MSVVVLCVVELGCFKSGYWYDSYTDSVNVALSLTTIHQSPRTLHLTAGFIYWESLQSTKAEDGEVLSPRTGDTALDLNRERSARERPIEEHDEGKNAIAGLMQDPILLKASLKTTTVLPNSTATAPSWSWDGKSRFSLSDMPGLSQVLYLSIRGPQQSPVFDRMIVPFDYPKLQDLCVENLGLHLSSPSDWFKVVEFYSTTSITHSKDKLIAISGLARHIHRRIRVPYYSGLWADRFLVQLLWFRGGCRFIWPVEPRAPSWSWAAVDGEIIYPLNVEKVSGEPNTRVLGLAAEPMVRGAAINRTSWLGGLGSPILQVKLRKMTGCGYSISGDEDLGSGLPKTRQTLFPLLKFRHSVLAMRLRYQSRTVGLIVWDDATFNGDQSFVELETLFPVLFCVRIAHVKKTPGLCGIDNVGPSSGTIIRRKPVFGTRRKEPPPQGDSDSDHTIPEQRQSVQPRWKSNLAPVTIREFQPILPVTARSPPISMVKSIRNNAGEPVVLSKTQSSRQSHTDSDDFIFFVLFLVPVTRSEDTFRRVASGQISPEFAEQFHMWESKIIAII